MMMKNLVASSMKAIRFSFCLSHSLSGANLTIFQMVLGTTMCRSVDSSHNRTLNQLIGAIGKLMVWADRNLTGYLQQDTWSLNSRLEVKIWEKS